MNNKQHSLYRIFRHIGIVEGVTTVLLFFVAMPMKYFFDMPKAVTIMGSIHGWAFILYILAMIVALRGRQWTTSEWFRTTIAAFFPFGTFLNDPFLKRKQFEKVRS